MSRLHLTTPTQDDGMAHLIARMAQPSPRLSTTETSLETPKSEVGYWPPRSIRVENLIGTRSSGVRTKILADSMVGPV